jgi:Holliday junction DNA helicase RuvA
MISSLEGRILLKAEKFFIIETSGVGYKAFATAETLQKLPEKGSAVKVWTHEHIREDARELYAFLHYAELELFELVISVPGIGPKGGLGVLAIAEVDTLKKAIGAGDTSYLTRVSGIGRKTAEKIVLELKEKMSGRGVTIDAPELKDEADALEALVSLGYTQRDARSALAEVSDKELGVEARVREALKKFGKK